MPLSLRVAASVSVSVSVTMAPAATCIAFGQLARLPALDRVDYSGNRPGARNEHLDPCIAKPGDGAAADALAGNGIDRVSSEDLNVVAGSMVLMALRVPHDLEGTAVRVHDREEWRAAEMVERSRLESAIIFGRDTDLHGCLLLQ